MSPSSIEDVFDHLRRSDSQPLTHFNENARNRSDDTLVGSFTEDKLLYSPLQDHDASVPSTPFIKHDLASEYAIDEALMSNTAINEAFHRYQSGADLYLVPMTRVALEDVLRRYARDALHNTIALSRSKLAFGNGSYGRILQLLYDSIGVYLDETKNVDFLLDMHRTRHDAMNDLDFGSSSPTRWIKIK